jgi:hypothetical protein
LTDHHADAALSGGSGLSSDLTGAFSVQASLSGVAAVVSSIQVYLGYAAPVVYPSPARVCYSGKMILNQVDLFLADGKTRAQDVQTTDLLLRVYVDDSPLGWTLVSGVGVPDVRVAAGRVYWTEFSTGFYSIRFFPNALGVWRILLTFPAHDQAVSLSYSVVPQVRNDLGSGMRASFIRR